METPDKRWVPAEREHAYSELEHPADIFLEVYGRDLPSLFENALFALYDQLAQLEDFETTAKRRIDVKGPSASDALRALLSEALYLFETQAFIAAHAAVRVETKPQGEVEVIGGTARRHPQPRAPRRAVRGEGRDLSPVDGRAAARRRLEATVLFDV